MADYLLPAEITPVAASEAIGAHLDVRGGCSRAADRTYYDTFDGLLHAAGLVAVWEDGWLALLEREGERIRARTRLPKPNAPLFASDVPTGGLSDALQALIDVRALLPLIEIRCRERRLDVLDGERKTVVRLSVQQPALGRRRLHRRVQVVGVRGYDKPYRRVNELLETGLGCTPAQPLVDEAVLSIGGRPGGTPATIEASLDPGQRTDAAAALILRALLRVIENNLDGAIGDLDSEFLHDLRVAIRRSRTVQRELRGAFPPQQLESFRTEFRRLQRLTGEARDLDVYVLEFDSLRTLVPEQARADLGPLLEVLRRRRAGARRRMVRALRSSWTATLLGNWSRFLDRLEELPHSDRPDAARPIAEIAGARIARVYGRMVNMGSAIGPLSAPEGYHDLRKQGKELRYLLELFGARLYPDAVTGPMIRALKALQDVLGCQQDREIQAAMMRSLGHEVSLAHDGAEALMAMGILVERLEADQRAARDGFAARFAAFASPRQRALVRETFC